jgi:lycopene cyclase domain-containing protein
VSHWLYLAILAGCVVPVAALELIAQIGVLRRWRRLAVTVGAVAVPFLAWDAGAVHAGQWTFSRHWTTGVRIGALPVEEIAFFVVVPVCAVATLEAVRRVRPVWFRR